MAAAPPGAVDAVVGQAVPIGDQGSVTVSAVEGDVDAGRLFAPPRGKKRFDIAVKGCSGPRKRTSGCVG